jgi:hypothetical protein
MLHTSDIHVGNWEGTQYTIFDSPSGATGIKDCMITICVDETSPGNAQLNVNNFNAGEEIPKGMCRTWYARNVQKVRVIGTQDGITFLSKGTYTISII